jgi:glucose-1-phosphate cytidylyltransferase
MTKNLGNLLKGIPVVILCGGRKVLLNDGNNEPKNKALVLIDKQPLFWWVMMQYVLYGAEDFILSTGTQSEDFHTTLLALGANQSSENHNLYTLNIHNHTCQIRLVESGDNATTSKRLIACKPFLRAAKVFALTYSDTLSDINLAELFEFHRKHGLVASLVGAQFPMRFRILGIRYNEIKVRAFASRPVIEAALINGGFYFFTDQIWNDQYQLTDDSILENQTLETLAKLQQLAAFEHTGKWQNFDSERDLKEVNSLAKELELMIIGN